VFRLSGDPFLGNPPGSNGLSWRIKDSGGMAIAAYSLDRCGG